jgi:hypothetical protein
LDEVLNVVHAAADELKSSDTLFAREFPAPRTPASLRPETCESSLPLQPPK